MLVVPVFPAASRTVPVNVCVPFVTGVPPAGAVGQGIVTVPGDDVVGDMNGIASALSVKLWAAPLGSSAPSPPHTVPLTVSPFLGCVMNPFPVLGGGACGLTPTPMSRPEPCPVQVMSSVMLAS